MSTVVSAVALAAVLLGSGSASAAPAEAAADRCSGPLNFGRTVTCASIRAGDQHVYTVTTTEDSDRLFTQLTRGSGAFARGRVTAADGSDVCFVNVDAGACDLGPAGTYTITVSVQGAEDGNYTLAVESMRTPSSCLRLADSFFSFASDGRTATRSLGAAARCYRFDQPTGAVLHLTQPGGGDVQGDILGAGYQPAGCYVRYTNTCTLTEPGPYVLFLYEYYGDAVTYTLKMARISHPAGCPAFGTTPFGDPGGAVGAGTLAEPNDVRCHRIRTTEAGPVAVRLAPGTRGTNWTVYDPAGQLLCNNYEHRQSCPLPAAGDYALLVNNPLGFGPVDYQVAATALFRGNGCQERTETSWDVPTLVVHQTSPVQVNCQPFRGLAGERFLVFAAPFSFDGVTRWIVDRTGATVCDRPEEGQDGCVLPATGTYRLVSHRESWDDEVADAAYKLQIRRLTRPVGCLTVRPGAYDAPPAAAPDGNRCRVLDIPAAGHYRVQAVSPENSASWITAYDAAGSRVCSGSVCPFPAAGRYTAVLDTGGLDDVAYAQVLLPARPSGCAQAADTGYQGPPLRGGFEAVGQVNCLELASPAGARVVQLLPADATGAGRPSVQVVDAEGAQVCDEFTLRQYQCQLDGAGPFHAVIEQNDGVPPGPYATAFARVDGAPACPVAPRGPDGVTAATGPDGFAACFSIPADQHAARETFTYRRTSGAGGALMSVFGADGGRYCRTSPSSDRTFTCTVPEGPVTVILEADSVDAEYQFTHAEAATP
ncbi:MAG TPA: hypothetical protein VFT95_03125 [Micromonosporaceae bacterium]|nr:hypothetical protein [Micromonosporaceae bacterium]